MKRQGRYLLLWLVLFVAFVSLGPSVYAAGKGYQEQQTSDLKLPPEQSGKILYTQVNIWHEGDKAIPSTNYHRGVPLRVGTKVVMEGYSNDTIKFHIADSPRQAYIIVITKHTKEDVNEMVRRYFGDFDPMAPGGDFDRLTRQEQDNVRNGTIEVGMSRKAVIMAYGYPPSHQTPSIQGDAFTYWVNRFHTRRVSFTGDKVSYIK
jgi:hypothetical protein